MNTNRPTIDALKSSHLYALDDTIMSFLTPSCLISIMQSSEWSRLARNHGCEYEKSEGN